VGALGSSSPNHDYEALDMAAVLPRRVAIMIAHRRIGILDQQRR
jgi:hypothetical protein